MEETTDVIKDVILDNVNEDNQDFIENDASDYESINSGNDEDNNRNEHNSDYESDSVQNIEREEGDGQESIPPKKVDDDEDKKNPQYIPKRGTFYEHDDRTMEDEEEEDTEDKKDRQTKKSIWIEKKEQWGHDRFNENEQAPKSKTELIGIYGYDIRNEDGPPRARRRRRYGRGPNKYTRTWEDEDAYKPAKPVKILPKKSKNPDEFPPLHPNEEELEDEVIDTKPIEKQIQFSNVVSNGKDKPVETKPKIEQPKPNFTENVVPVKIQQKEIKPADYSGFTKVRQYKNSQIEQKIVKTQGNPGIENLEEEVAKLTIGRKQNRQNNVPPRLQNEQKGSKRYSSLRQRSLPETAASTTFNQQTYYTNDYTPPQPQQAILSQPPPQAVLQQIPAAIQQVSPVTGTALLPTPTQFAAPFPPASAAFIPSTIPPPPFISPQTQIINYVPSPPQFAQAPFQGFQHQPFNPVPTPAELNYQCQGGTTYYSTQNQHLGHGQLLRRPKAAIPIVPPPPQEPRGRGRTNNCVDTPSPGAEDNNDYENVHEFDYEDVNLIVQ